MQVFEINNPYYGSIIKRPSVVSKTPYVADILINDNVTCCHTPSLGCCGLAEAGSNIIMSKLQSGRISEYRAELSVHSEEDNTVVVGINPKLSETIAEICLQNGLINGLEEIYEYGREKTYMNSRFDFAGIDKDEREFIMEIKSVPQADYVDVPKSMKKNYTEYMKQCNFNEKIAYFPDGFRKKLKENEVVSPRALKHIHELELLVKFYSKRAILCFMIQRSDVNVFQTSHIDPIYRDAVYKAWINGVEIKAIQLEWSQDGKCTFVRNDIPIILSDTIGPHMPLKKLKLKKRTN